MHKKYEMERMNCKKDVNGKFKLSNRFLPKYTKFCTKFVLQDNKGCE